MHSDEDDDDVVGNAEEDVVMAALFAIVWFVPLSSMLALLEVLLLLLLLLLLLERPKSCCIANGDLWGTWLLDVLIRWLWSVSDVCDGLLDIGCDEPGIESNGRVSVRWSVELEFNTIFIASIADSQDRNAPEDDTLNGLNVNS